jgi:hypothetical protein
LRVERAVLDADEVERVVAGLFDGEKKSAF